MEHDIFIIHSSKDKETVARPLTGALQMSGLSVWLDEEQLQVGDSIRRKLGQALTQSSFWVVIFSRAYLDSEWAQKELDTLITRKKNHKNILPIIHDVQLTDIEHLAPMLLVDKMLLTTADGIEALADKLFKIVYNAEAEELEKAKPRKVDKWKRFGEISLKQGDLYQAEAFYQKALEIEPNDPENHSKLGDISKQRGDLDQAEAFYQQALEIRPNAPQNHYKLGEISRQRGDLNQAEAFYRRALEIGPHSSENYSKLGDISQQRGDLNEAEAFYRRALEIEPNTPAVLSGLGDISQQRGDFNQAVVFYRRALEIRPNAPESYSKLGDISQQLGDLDQAEEFYQQALTMSQEFVDTGSVSIIYSNIGNLAQQQGNFQKAEDFYQKSLRINQEIGNKFGEASELSNLGLVSQELGKLERARSFFKKAIKIHGELGQQEKIIKLKERLNEIEQRFDGIFPDDNFEEVYVSSPPVFPCAWAAEWGQDQYGLWQAFNYLGIRHAFRWIPLGTFLMGSPHDEDGRYDREDQRLVTLSKGFWLGETAVTQKLWEVVMHDDNPSSIEGGQLPVETVSWNNCNNFIQKLNNLHSGFRFSLPWEAIWEYACRAGTTTAFSFGNKEDLNLERVNYSGQWSNFESNAKTKPVKTYPPNDWGLYEMHGNVFEWCQDIWQENLGTDAVIDPYQEVQDDQNVRRVIRGGARGSKGEICRAAFRSGHVQDNRHANLGFRLALL